MTGSGQHTASAPDTRATPFVRCTLSAGDIETTYRWAGRGGVPIVVLGHPACTHELCDESDCLASIAPLVGGGRVLVPERTTTAALAPSMRGESWFLPWFRGFLEGVGLTNVWVVAPAAYATELRALRSANAEQIARIVLVGDVPNETSDDTVITTATWSSAMVACTVRYPPAR